MQGKILGAAHSRNAPAYTLSSEFHFFNAFPSRKRMQRYRLLRNRQAFLETFLKLSEPASIPRNFFETFSGINSQISDKQSNKITQITAFSIKRSKSNSIYNSRTREYFRETENERTFPSKRTHVLLKTKDIFIETNGRFQTPKKRHYPTYFHTKDYLCKTTLLQQQTPCRKSS